MYHFSMVPRTQLYFRIPFKNGMIYFFLHSACYQWKDAELCKYVPG
jgi:hypothetical protein